MPDAFTTYESFTDKITPWRLFLVTFLCTLQRINLPFKMVLVTNVIIYFDNCSVYVQHIFISFYLHTHMTSLLSV